MGLNSPLTDEAGASVLNISEDRYYRLPKHVRELFRSYAIDSVTLPNGTLQIKIATYRIAEIEAAMRQEDEGR